MQLHTACMMHVLLFKNLNPKPTVRLGSELLAASPLQPSAGRACLHLASRMSCLKPCTHACHACTELGREGHGIQLHKLGPLWHVLGGLLLATSRLPTPPPLPSLPPSPTPALPVPCPLAPSASPRLRLPLVLTEAVELRT